MSSHYPPVTYADFVSVLGSVGFVKRPSKRGSHEQWVRNDHRGFFKVTVDRPKAPFTRDLLGYMLRQAGMSRREFYGILRTL